MKKTWYWVLPRQLQNTQQRACYHRETCGAWRSTMIPVSMLNVATGKWRPCARCNP